MPYSSPSRTRGGLIKSPNLRQQAARRWMYAVCGLLALALASGVAGAMIDRQSDILGKPQTGPFSYFPAE